jgi:hypothetical protein
MHITNVYRFHLIEFSSLLQFTPERGSSDCDRLSGVVWIRRVVCVVLALVREF